MTGNKHPVAVSQDYVESILTSPREKLGEGFFGTVFKGSDDKLRCSFAIKAIKTDILLGGHATDFENARDTFMMEQKVCH